MIKRYDIEHAADIPESLDGDWVAYTDHAAEVSRLEGEVKRLTVELKLAQQALANVKSGTLKVNLGPE